MPLDSIKLNAEGVLNVRETAKFVIMYRRQGQCVLFKCKCSCLRYVLACQTDSLLVVPYGMSTALNC